MRLTEIIKKRTTKKRKNKAGIYKKIRIACILAPLLLAAGCAGSAAPKNDGAADEEARREEESAALKAGDFVTVLKTDPQKETVDVKRVAGGNKYTLSYTGTTEFSDKYGQSVAVGQIMPGELVDIVYSAHSKTLLRMEVSKEAWTNDGVDKFELNEARKTIEIGQDIYKFTKDLVIVSEGEEAELMDLNVQDVLSLKGTGKTVHSIIVEKGHGYIRLMNEEQFLDGFVEVGQSVILPVTEDMLITAPEGEYDLRISKDGFGGSAPVTVNRGEETVIDVGELYDGVLKNGDIAFSVTPSNASLYINGEEQDYSELITLPYGVHQIMLKADGYVTLAKYINVGQPLASIEIEMEKTEEAKEKEEQEKEEKEKAASSSEGSGTSSSETPGQTTSSTSLFHPETQSRYRPPTNRRYGSTGSKTNKSSSSASSSSSSASSSASSSSGGGSSSEIISPSGEKKIYVDGPAGAEVYFDNHYVGVAPVSFKKEAGNHTISLRMEGFKNKSYTVDIDDSTGDVTYAFSPLISEGE